MHQRKTRNGPRSTFRFQTEPLEKRDLLAGMVDGVVRGTTLRLNGDDLANDIVISSSANGIEVTGNATEVAIEGDLSRVRQIVLKTGDGNDTTTLNDLALRRNVTIKSPSGNLTVNVTGTTEIGGHLFSHTVTGDHEVVLQESAQVARLTQKTTNGDSVTTVKDEAVVEGLLRAITKNGDSDVRVIDEAFVGRYVGSGVQVTKNVIYAERDTGDLKADIYAPNRGGPHPAVVMIHGGAWTFGDKRSMANRAKATADRGYVVVNVNYRLAPAHQMPAMIEDVKSAVIWMRQNAVELNIDPNRIGAYGYSAGAHLALMLGVTDGSEGLEGPDADGTSSRVQAVVAGAPATDFRTVGPNSRKFEVLFGGTRSELPDAYAQASPANWISADDAPTLIFKGSRDRLINGDNIDDFVQGLDAAGVENRYVEIASKTHLSAASDALALSESLRFLDDVLKG